MIRCRLLLLLSLFLVGIHTCTNACPSCYGASDSPLAQGMNTAILIMLGITGFVLGLFVMFFVILWKRSRIFNDRPSDKAFVNDSGALRWNNS